MNVKWFAFRGFLFLLLLLLFGCDKGLAPPPGQGGGYYFPKQPDGGNPMGTWIPDSTDAIEVHFLAQVPADSVLFETAFEGVFKFEQTFVCSIYTALSFKPLIYNGGDLLPLDINVADTVQGQGLFEIVDEKILLLPVRYKIFNLSALGFNAATQRLDLITQALEYEYQGFYKLNYYLILHLIRDEQ
jgi:hypothetical protein